MDAGKPSLPSRHTLPDPGDSDEEEDEKEHSGEIEIPNLSDENDLEDIDVCWYAVRDERKGHTEMDGYLTLDPGFAESA